MIIREKAMPEQITALLETLQGRIKLAVDVNRRVLIGGGELLELD